MVAMFIGLANLLNILQPKIPWGERKLIIDHDIFVKAGEGTWDSQLDG